LYVGHHQVWTTILCCLKAFKPIPRQHDGCTPAIQEQTQIPARIVIIFHNDNREIAKAVRQHRPMRILWFVPNALRESMTNLETRLMSGLRPLSRDLERA